MENIIKDIIKDMNILNKLNDLHLFWNILDFVKESPKQCYKLVIEELDQDFKMKCNKHCGMFTTQVFDGMLIRMPMIARSTHAACTICRGSVSEYGHRFCISCAQKGTPEYNYHHRRCRGFIEENNPITNPIPENFVYFALF